jgi:hypothetical protein
VNKKNAPDRPQPIPPVSLAPIDTSSPLAEPLDEEALEALLEVLGPAQANYGGTGF